MLTRFTRGPLRGPRAWKQFRSSRARMNRRVKRPFRQSGVGKRTVAAGYTGERRTIAYRGQTTTAYRRGGETDGGGFARLRWSKVEAWREWARLSEGCYVLRSNVTDWSPEDLWREIGRG